MADTQTADSMTHDLPRVSLALASQNSRHHREDMRPAPVLAAMSKPVANVDAAQTRAYAIERLGLMLARLSGWKRVSVDIIACNWEAAGIAARLDPAELYFIVLGEIGTDLRRRLGRMMNGYLDRLGAEHMVQDFMIAWRFEELIRPLLDTDFTLMSVHDVLALKLLARLREREADDPDSPTTWCWPPPPDIECEAIRRYEAACESDLFGPAMTDTRFHPERTAWTWIERYLRGMLDRATCDNDAGARALARTALGTFEAALLETVEASCRPL